jgi:dihydrofolate reductase
MHFINIKINIIVSVSENWVIGKNNKLLWNLNSDLKRFKELTTGHPIIMGQRTFESLPKGALPNRTNIVLTDDLNFSASNVIVAYNIDDALKIAEGYCGDSDDVFIIGGGMIYKQFLEMADFVYLTTVHTTLNGDTSFPKLDDNWKLISEEFKSKDDKNDYDHTYKIYKHIKYLYDEDEDEDEDEELSTIEKEERKYSGYAVRFNEPNLNGIIIKKEAINLDNFQQMKIRGDIIDYTIDENGVKVIKKFKETHSLKRIVDWNNFSLDELADYLEDKCMFNSSGEALAIFKMVDFYRKHKNIKNNNN